MCGVMEAMTSLLQWPSCSRASPLPVPGDSANSSTSCPSHSTPGSLLRKMGLCIPGTDMCLSPGQFSEVVACHGSQTKDLRYGAKFNEMPEPGIQQEYGQERTEMNHCLLQQKALPTGPHIHPLSSLALADRSCLPGPPFFHPDSSTVSSD